MELHDQVRLLFRRPWPCRRRHDRPAARPFGVAIPADEAMARDLGRDIDGRRIGQVIARAWAHRRGVMVAPFPAVAKTCRHAVTWIEERIKNRIARLRFGLQGAPMRKDAEQGTRPSPMRDGVKRARPGHDAHVRLAGTIRVGARYVLLEGDDGYDWRLRSEEDLTSHHDRRVTVEARVNAIDELVVFWVGAGDAGAVG